MRAHTKKHPTDELVAITLHVRRSKVPQLQRFAESLDGEEDRSYSISEAFPEYVGREQEVALRAYRNREGLTQQNQRTSGTPMKSCATFSAWSEIKSD